MKNTLPILFVFITSSASAQLLAGEVPSGATALDLNIDIELSTAFTIDSAGLEIDCDDFPDIMAVLVRGMPEVDAPNVAMLRMIDDDLEICADGVPNYSRPQYHAYGQPMDCAGTFNWQGDEYTTLGDFGSFTAIGPTSIDSLYIAVRRGAQAGWILLSFELTGSAPHLRIHQALSLCYVTALNTHEASLDWRIVPTLTHGEPLRVEGTADMQRLEVLDATGRIVAAYGGNVRTINAPDAMGSYLLQAVDTKGRRSVQRFVRQ